MTSQPTLETDRLFLRPFALSDAPRVRELACDFAIADTTLNVPHPYKDGMAEEWISTHLPKYETGELVNFAITVIESDLLIGAISMSINARFRRAELGYWVGEEYWNCGYCTEAARAVIKYGFSQLSLNKIVAHHISRNPASGRVMIKSGMRKEGSFREHVFKAGKFEDLEGYGILRSDWEVSAVQTNREDTGKP